MPSGIGATEIPNTTANSPTSSYRFSASLA
jgi:hypothetical protein